MWLLQLYLPCKATVDPIHKIYEKNDSCRQKKEVGGRV